MALITKVDYSIIVCTYNPDKGLLSRCLQAISGLLNDDLSIEVILVDNNSTNPVAKEAYVNDFLGKIPGSKLLLVKEQGLNYARMAGVEESTGANIVFFDDDNEPEANYIQVMARLNRTYPNVAVWGPGSISVDFINGVNKPLEECARNAFQYRREKAIAYSNQQSWQPCYPFGTGFCLKRNHLEEYISLARQKKFTITDRKGGQMTSAGDTQMVLFCVSKGAAAGVAPDLKLTHIVPAKRTSFKYLKKLAYGTSVCYGKCISEVYPDYILDLEKRAITEMQFIRRTFKKYLSLFFYL